MTDIITINNLPAAVADQIQEIEDQSDEFINRARVIFKNGLWLSIIMGRPGGIMGLNPTYGVEIAAGQEDPKHDGHWFFRHDLYLEEDSGDQVIGYCDREKVEKYMQIVAFAQKVDCAPKSPWEIHDEEEAETPRLN
jgi:hypothetical protein